ncbi:MAG: response regulator, partial [Desulfobulbaceae bacterium]|nr:response regulator [Desulfobulbaceae bacterium]
TRIPCIVTATPFSDANGRLIGIVEDFKDISGQKRAEKEKAQLEDDLRHSQKMEAVGTLAGGIAHDFNNILNGMLTYTRLLKDGITKGSEQENFVQEIIKGGKQAANLVRQILAFSKRTEYKRRPLQIQPIIREALKFLKRSLPTTIELRQHLDSDTRAVLADETQIYQVVMNLCTNAYHAMREHGGILEVRLEQVDTDSVLIGKIGDLKGRKFVRLTVSDTGHGMDKFTRQRIFDPYFTTKEQGEGTGLGLSRVHGIVMRHKGAISVKSRPGKGSEFTIYLPVVDLAPATQEPHKETKLTHEGHGRILFVDDAEYNARSGKLILESIGFEVTALTDSAQALEVFREDPNRFDIVVTDQTMPQMTGFELAQELFHVRPDLPVIMITGHSEIVDSERAKSIGIREFLLKPLDIDLLAETITNILDSAKKNSG